VHSPLPFIPEQLANENKERSESAPRTANIHYAPVRFMDIEKSVGCFLENPSFGMRHVFFCRCRDECIFPTDTKTIEWLAIHSRRFYIFKCNCCQEINCLCRPFIYACAALMGHNGWRRQSLSLPDSDNKKAAGIF
jgi:hypothetical protein